MEEEKNKWTFKYSCKTLVPTKDEQYSNKEGWLNIEVVRVGDDCGKKIPDDELDALDDTIKAVMGRVHKNLEKIEVQFREWGKITRTTEQIDQQRELDAAQRKLEITERIQMTQKGARD